MLDVQEDLQNQEGVAKELTGQVKTAHDVPEKINRT